MRGLNEYVSMDEVAQIHLPTSRLLNLYVAAEQQLFQVTDTFLGSPAEKVPYIIGIAGSVAAGKSTISRILQALLSRWPDHPRVALVTTDGFLHPNRVLQEREIMHRKGFPESYDVRKLVQFVSDVKSGKPVAEAPVYSHLVYDIVPDEFITVEQPDILILEGLNVLQRGADSARTFVSDFFDFSVYVDATEEALAQWFTERFLRLRETAFRDASSYFHRYASITTEEAIEISKDIWSRINGLNLRENIEPTRERANLILEKGVDHSIQRVRLRKL